MQSDERGSRTLSDLLLCTGALDPDARVDLIATASRRVGQAVPT